MDLEIFRFDNTVEMRETVHAREFVVTSADKVSNLNRFHEDDPLALNLNSVGGRETLESAAAYIVAASS
jgi:hypothetical protein